MSDSIEKGKGTMVKNKKKYRVTAWLWALLMYIFMGALCACSEEEKWISIGEEAGAENLTGEWIAESKNPAKGDNTGTDSLSEADVGGDEGVNQTETPLMIQVYVCGAVKEPGVVSVPPGSRVEAALIAAGGFAEDAAEGRVNLADWVTDGQMLYFPTGEEAAQMRTAESDAGTGLVNLNTADMSKLCTLPGIGEGRAADIIAYREKNGGFSTCEEIMNVPGIKEAVYEKIRDRIAVN